jgi:peptidoglycan/LPS O-acetylase OafA/YrhL
MIEIRKLNSLRFLAAFIVFVNHYSNQTDFFGKLFGSGAGQMGVMLFFILSGFLMSYLYMERSFIGKEVRNFAVARIARVIPLYLFLVIGSYYTYIFGLGAPYEINSPCRFISSLLLLRGYSLMWTIPIEIHFYFIFVLIWWIASKRVLYALFFMAAAFYVITIYDYPVYMGAIGFVDYLIAAPRFFSYFFIGVAFGQLYGKWCPPKHGVFLSSLLIIPVLFPHIFGSIFKHQHGMWTDPLVLLCMSLVFFIVLFFVPDDTKIMSNKVGDFLGKISYSVYLLHLPLIKLMRTHARDHPGIFFFVCLALTIAISTASYYLIEKPCRKAIRERFGA